MTPNLAQAVDPIFLKAFATLKKIDDGEPVQHGILRRELEALFRDADQLLRDDDNWKLSKYALTAWIDEMFGVSHEWDGKDTWTQKPIEQSLFGTARAYDRFFEQAKTSSESAGGDDPVEMYFVSVLLGYRGFYANHDAGRSASERDLPTSASDWVSQFGHYIQQAQERRASTASRSHERSIRTATPFWTRSLIVWPWVLVTVLVGLNILLYFWPS